MIDHVGRNLEVVIGVDDRLVNGVVSLTLEHWREDQHASQRHEKIAFDQNCFRQVCWPVQRWTRGMWHHSERKVSDSIDISDNEVL